MAEQTMKGTAQQILDQWCKLLDSREIRYRYDQEEGLVECVLGGEDMPMIFYFEVDEDRALIVLTSLLPVIAKEEQRLDMMVALAEITDHLFHGRFDANPVTGEVRLRIANSYGDGMPQDAFLTYLLDTGVQQAEKYNHLLFMLANDVISLEKFFLMLDETEDGEEKNETVDAAKRARAEQVYAAVCAWLDSRGWEGDRDPEKLGVRFGLSTEDMPVHCNFTVNAEKQLLYVYSPIPFYMRESMRTEGAVMTGVASACLRDGSFDYKMATGRICFRLATSLCGLEIGAETMEYFVNCTHAVVDHFNDRFEAVNNGQLSLHTFVADEM